MLRLFGCRLESDDVDRLAAALSADGDEQSLETAAAIRWGAQTEVEAGELDSDVRATLVRAAAGARPSLGLN